MQHYNRHIEKQTTDKIQLAFIRKVGVKGTKEGFPCTCMSCRMLHPNMKD